MNEQTGVAVMVHGDDYLCSGPVASLIQLRDQSAKVFETKDKILGHAQHQEKEGKLLNRLIKVLMSHWKKKKKIWS